MVYRTAKTVPWLLSSKRTFTARPSYLDKLYELEGTVIKDPRVMFQPKTSSAREGYTSDGLDL